MFPGKAQKQVDLQLFVIYDSKTESYREPMCAINMHDLYRQFFGAFQEQRNKNRFYANAEDFSVFQIGEYSYKTGKLTVIEPKSVINLHELKAAVINSDSEQKINNENLDTIRQAIRLELAQAQPQSLGH